MSPVANEKFQVLGELIPQPDYFWSLLLIFFQLSIGGWTYIFNFFARDAKNVVKGFCNLPAFPIAALGGPITEFAFHQNSQKVQQCTTPLKDL